jgi:outer membrane autotransporter protein
MEERIMKECSKWKSGKRFLTAAITLSLLGSLGLYSPAAYAEEDFEEYTGSITGKEDNASEYVMAHITKDGGKNYKFTDDSLIKTNQGVKVGDLDYPVNIDASGHVLKFYGHVNDKHTLVHAVEANSKKGVTITAKKLIIDAGNTKSRAEGISVGGQNGTNKDAPYRLTINGDTDIRAHGDTYGLGMYLCGNAEVTVNGNVTMNTHDEKNPWAVYVEKDGGLSYYGGSAIYAGNNYKLQLGPKLTINGLVDLKVNANGAFANGGHSDIYLRGGNIEINKDNTKGYYALLAECATTTMNMERDENKVPVRAGSAKVTIKGNIGASAGAINVNEPETYSRTNLGLATPDSSWTGIAYNAFKDEGNEVSGTLYGSDEIIKKTFFGEINLWLQNGASWTNEAWGEPPDAYYGEDFSESHLKRLVGGESADKAGHIFQKPGEDEDSEGINIRVDDYKGFTNVYYGHKDEKPTDILGGTFTVTKAQTGSGITLITDSKGLNVDSSKAADKNLASETLNALANKLFYTAYKNGETNLTGKVEIAEGLTASSLSKRIENVTFKESNGQGQYLYTPASDIPEEQTETAFTDTITGVKAKDMKYVNTGVRKEDGTYKFTKDSEITVAAGGPAVNVEEDVIIRADGKTLKMKTVEGSGTVYGINQSTAKKAEITAKNLDVEVTSTSRAEGIHMANSNAAIQPEMTINGDVNLKVSGTANTLGAYIQGNSRLTVNGNVTADVDGHNGGFSYYGATGLYSTSNMGPNSMGADITVNGNVDLKGKAHGIFANAGGSKVTVNGGGSIEVDKTSTNPYAAIRAEDGVVSMNVKLDSSGNAVGSLDKKVNIKGNLAVTTGAVNAVDKRGTLSQINLGLTTADSTFQGVVYNAFPDEGKKAGELTFKGEANLFLANGAAWTNEKYIDTGTSWGGKNFEGSHLTRLAGGASADKAGQIFQKDTGNITVDNYSGYTDVYYAHEETAPKTMIGGDFIIRKAASGSGISLITDNKGLNTSSNASADKNLVSETLNALANKLFYKAYADGEKNLTGFVKIAEGLTSSEAVLKTGNITFKKDNGQGQYLYETAYPNEQITDPINKTIDGSAASEQAYKEAGVYKSDTDTYKFTKNPATINGDSGAAVDAGTKDIHVDSGENTLNLNGGNTGVGVKAEGGKTADIKGNANITGQTGVLADGAGSKVLLSGNSNITAGGDGIVASGGGTVEAAGITNVTAGAGGKAVRAGGGSSVSLQNGKLKGDVEADNGTVSLHGAETEGNATAAAGGSINLTGGSVAGQVTAKDGNSQAIIKNATVKDLIGSHGGTASITGGIVTGTVSADDGTVKAESTKVNESVNAKNGGTVELKQGSAGRLASEGGRITANGTAVKGDASANAGGTVEMTGGSVGGNTTADNGTIETENTDVANGASALNGGKLKLRNGTVSGGIKTDAASASDVVMDRVGASLQGDVSGEGKTNVTLSNGGNWKGNSAGSGETKVKVGSGGTWTGASMNGDTDVDLEGKWKQTNNSKVRKLISNNGVLDKTAPESGNTDIGQLSGSLSLIYAHDKTNPTKVLGGGTFIAAADAGSTVDMITDNAGLDTNSKKAADKNRVSEALNALAGKLQYTGYQNGERNLKGKLRIAEGLTSSSAGLKTEALSFKRDGQGYFDYTPAKPDKPEIETGDYETSIMSSTRSALTSSILVWRNDMNDMYKRMGDLRIGAESGLWARAYGGRISYDANNAYMKDSYWAAQVGMDKRLASGWHVGGAFGYTDGSATYRYGGKGDPKLYTLAAYATRVSEDGQYVDVIAKAGKLSNKFTAYNKYSAPVLRNYVEGKYDTYGYGISAEYGKKIRMGKGFITPQAELTWSRLSSDSFDAAAPTGESMRVSQSSVNSLVGRLGVVAGVESDKGNFYAKVNLFHEFDGDGHILFTEPGKTGKRSSFSLKDTWAEIALGGNYYLSPRSMIYADFTKSFGGDYKVDWRINAGIRFSF